MYDDDDQIRHPSEIRKWPMTINVPLPPESKASGVGDRGFHSSFWYEREFDAVPRNGRVILHFGAVDYAAKVWVNGRVVVTHEGGHTPFWADITDVLNSSGRQTVSVAVDDDPHDLTKPRGKQDWQLKPHAIWYPRTSGIWQTVWLEHVASTYIQKVRWTPHVEGFAFTFEARIAGPLSDDLTVEVVLRHEDRILARDTYGIIG